MKRNNPAKRKDRRTGMSPYARHGKREYLYSGAYQEWRAQFVKRERNAR